MEDFKAAFTTLTKPKEGDLMADISRIQPFDQLEARLRAELDQAEKALRSATPEDKAEAKRHFKDALHRFSVWVFTGRLEPRQSLNSQTPIVTIFRSSTPYS